MRCLFLTLLALSLAALPALAQEPASRPTVQSAAPARILLTWTGDPARTQTVTWRTCAPVVEPRAELVPAPAGPAGFQAATSHPATSKVVALVTEATVHYHTVTFTDLLPGTRYSYRVGAQEHWSEWNDFTTAFLGPGTFSFLYFGDAQNGLATFWPRIFRAAFAEAPRARFALFAGDLVDLGLHDEHWADLFASAGWVLRSLPVLATPGNHEYFSLERGGQKGLPELWKAQFPYPANGLPGLQNTCYFLDYQNLRVISLDSNALIGEQAAWLASVLADNPARWTAVSFHHPIHSTAIKRNNKKHREAWMPILDAHGVDLVLQGHDHVYGRLQNPPPKGAPQSAAGTVYVVSVGGSKMYGAHPENTAKMVRVAEDTQFFQVITVSHERLDYQARTGSSELYDAFTLLKDSRGFKRLIDRIPPTPERRRTPARAFPDSVGDTPRPGRTGPPGRSG